MIGGTPLIGSLKSGALVKPSVFVDDAEINIQGSEAFNLSVGNIVNSMLAGLLRYQNFPGYNSAYLNDLVADGKIQPRPLAEGVISYPVGTSLDESAFQQRNHQIVWTQPILEQGFMPREFTGSGGTFSGVVVPYLIRETFIGSFPAIFAVPVPPSMATRFDPGVVTVMVMIEGQSPISVEQDSLTGLWTVSFDATYNRLLPEIPSDNAVDQFAKYSHSDSEWQLQAFLDLAGDLILRRGTDGLLPAAEEHPQQIALDGNHFLESHNHGKRKSCNSQRVWTRQSCTEWRAR